MANATMIKFGYPQTQVAETRSWSIQLRPQQPTLGSLVLVCREDVTAFSDLSAEAFADLQQAVTGVERVLRDFTAYQRINYLMLMMVDPNVHFHVLPRYEGTRDFERTSFADAGWPGQPRLDQAVTLSEAQLAALTAVLRGLWQDGRK
jgi:diadenosine tetraphosphate (Ap4A) HIT family hydrolase